MGCIGLLNWACCSDKAVGCCDPHGKRSHHPEWDKDMHVIRALCNVKVHKIYVHYFNEQITLVLGLHDLGKVVIAFFF